MMDDRPAFQRETEFELIEAALELRLRFLRTIAQLWQMGERPLPWNARLSPPIHRCHPEYEGHASRILAALAAAFDRRAGRSCAFGRSFVETRNRRSLGRARREHRIRHAIADETVSDPNHHPDGTQLPVRQWCLACALSPADDTVKTSADDVRIIEIYRAIMQRNADEVRRVLPGLLRSLQSKPLLYVPLEHGGEPKQITTARSMQMVIRFLLTHLPQLGMLRETFHLLRTGARWNWRVATQGDGGHGIDRLFRIALRNTLECVVKASVDWKGGRFSDEDLIEVVGTIVENYLDQWLEHSNTMRLSTVEALKVEPLWEETAEFVKTYGSYILKCAIADAGQRESHPAQRGRTISSAP